MSTARRLNDTDMGLGEISFSVPIFSPQVPHEMIWLSTLFSEVTGGQSIVQLLGIFTKLKRNPFVEIRSSVCLSVAYNLATI